MARLQHACACVRLSVPRCLFNRHKMRDVRLRCACAGLSLALGPYFAAKGAKFLLFFFFRYFAEKGPKFREIFANFADILSLISPFFWGGGGEIEPKFFCQGATWANFAQIPRYFDEILSQVREIVKISPKFRQTPQEGGVLRRLGARSRCFCCLDPTPH